MYKHVIADLYGCRTDALLWSSAGPFRKALVEEVAQVAAVLDVCWHRFGNDSYTGVLLLAESHCSIHTWPELNKVHFDLFTCGEKDAEVAFHNIRAVLQAEPHHLDRIGVIERT